MEEEIEAMFVDDIGWVYAMKDGVITDPIIPFFVNGEMASITWYRQGNREFNGKYVIEIRYVV